MTTETREMQTPALDKADRLASFTLEDFPIPGGREEEWRFTPLKRIAALFAAELSGTPPTVLVGDAELDADIQLPDGVHITREHGDIVGSIGAPIDRIGAVAWANRNTPICVRIDQTITEPIVLDIHGTSSQAAGQHVTVDIAPMVSATVVLRHTGSARLAQTVETRVGEGGNLTLVSTQEWELDALHAASHRLRVEKDAKLKHIVVTLGADLVRITTDVTFAGPGAETELLGVYFTDADQHHEHRLFIEHRLPNCISDAAYKGALQGKDAHSVWVGDVLIGHDATGTDTYELNRNLVLTEGARVDSVPNLEIETGEIEGAGHASATGRFDDEQLFYLQSRGIPEDAARRLVVRGFFAELIDRIGVQEVQDRLMDAIEAELDATAGLL
ncbi:MAG: Fe-S cluster assembly protein SufD [Bowdeniella nasicola]|nr:Fe-S cluster assembly protein SufD [Bowdeniella nasicola]